MPQTPDLGALLAEAVAFARGSMATAIPATVVVYDHVLQRVTVKPVVSGRYKDPSTDVLIPFPLPTLANVPVAFPSSTGFAITWPLFPGDTVYLVMADSSLDEWKSTGAQENVPQDIRRFDLSDAVAIPGLRPFARPIPPTGVLPTAMVLEGVEVRLGSALATDPVALSSLVLAEFAKLKAAIEGHVHSGVTTGPGSSGPVVPIPSVLPVPLGSVAATRVKAV